MAPPECRSTAGTEYTYWNEGIKEKRLALIDYLTVHYLAPIQRKGFLDTLIKAHNLSLNQQVFTDSKGGWLEYA